MLYDCWKMCVMMGAISSAVSLRTLAGSSSGPVALFWLRFFNCLIMPFVPISRGGMLEYNEGSITGMGYLSLVNTEVNWLLRAFALSRSFVIGLSFTLRVGMPMFSRLFALMNDQDRFGFVFRQSPIWLFRCVDGMAVRMVPWKPNNSWRTMRQRGSSKNNTNRHVYLLPSRTVGLSGRYRGSRAHTVALADMSCEHEPNTGKATPM